MDALLSQVKFEVVEAAGAVVGLARARGARFLTLLANAVDRGLILSVTSKLARAVCVKDETVFTFCAGVDVASAFGAMLGAGVTLASVFVVNLCFELALFGAFLVDRVEKHVTCTRCACKWTSFTSSTGPITWQTLTILKYGNFRRTLIQTLLLVQERSFSAQITGVATVGHIRAS